MPKDATKNIDRYKIRGGQLNEFEYTQSQQALAEKKPKGDAKLIPGTPPEEARDGLRPTVKAKANTASKGTKSTTANKAAKGSKKAAKGSTKTKVNSPRGATAKKLAARKAAKR